MVQNYRPISIAIALCIYLGQGMMNANALDPIARLAPSDVPAQAARAAAISGDYIALGAPLDPSGYDAGAVYVFRRLGPTWIEQAKLTVPDPQRNDQLGYSVAMEGDVIVAGAPHEIYPFPGNSGPGAVYVFRRDNSGTPEDPWDDTWAFETKLTVEGEPHWSLLGYSVAISDEVIVAGRPLALHGGPGSAEVFGLVSGQWVHERSLNGSDAHEGTTGWSVDIEGPRVVMASRRYEEDPGGVYVFKHDGLDWVEETKLTASDGAVLASQVAITQNYVVAGAPGVDDMGPNSNTGAAYVFERSYDRFWTESERLTVKPDDLAAFGQSIACDDGACLIAKDGFWGHGVWGQLFEKTDGQWVETEQLAGTDHPYRIAFSGPYAVIHGHVYIVRDRKSLHDFGDFQNCFGKYSDFTTCNNFGLGEDHEVDLARFEEFMATFGGP